MLIVPFCKITAPSEWKFQLFCILAKNLISLFNRGYVVVTHYGFNLHSPLNDVEHLCMSSVPLLSCVRLFVTPWTAARQASLSITNSWSFLNLKLHQVGDAIQPARPLSSPSPPAFDLFQLQGLFQWVSSSHQVAKYWSFNFSISPSNEYLRMTSFRIDCLDFLAVQGTLKCSLTSQLKSINSSALNFLYSPTLTSIHDYWKNDSFD